MLRSALCVALITLVAAGRCPDHWTLFRDTQHKEGHDSCIRFYPAPATLGSSTPWAYSKAKCHSRNAHLLTVKASSKTGLLKAAADLIPFGAGAAFIGCSQSPTASGADAIARKWSWVDGTSASNLNCGAGSGKSACGVWSLDEPNDFNDGMEDTGSTAFSEDYCQLYCTGYDGTSAATHVGVNDFWNQFASLDTTHTGGFVCEIDLDKTSDNDHSGGDGHSGHEGHHRAVAEDTGAAKSLRGEQ